MSTSVDPDLSQVLAKLRWARMHIDRLGAEVAAFKEREPHPWAHRTETEEVSEFATRYRIRAVIHESPPMVWALIAGDAVHNLRCSLDYLMWSITRPCARTRETAFPIFTDEAAFRKSERAASAMAEVVETHQEFVLRLQPYQWPKTAESHPLATLQRLSNTEKHQALLSVIPTVDLPYVGTSNAALVFEHLESRSLDDGAEIYRFVASREDDAEPMQVDPHATLQVALEGERHGRSVESVLAYIQSYVLGAVDAYFNHGILPE